MKVVFAGGRDFKDTKLALEICIHAYENKFIAYSKDVTGISGKAKGADSTFAEVILASGGKVLEFPAKWDDICQSADNPVQVATNVRGQYNRLAGFNRNRLMAEIGEKLVAVWNGSNGTKDMIEIMVKRDKPALVYNYDGRVIFHHQAGKDIKKSLEMLDVAKAVANV